MKRTSGLATIGLLTVLLVSTTAEAQPLPAVSGANCDNPIYDPVPTTATIQLCNNPLADGLFTEDGVTGYQYIYDVFMESGQGGSFHLGGSIGPLGTDGEFRANDSAWWRATPGDPSIRGIWQTWGNTTVTDDGTNSHQQGLFGGATVSTSTPAWTETDGAAVGDTRASFNTWDTSVTFNPVNNWFNDGATVPAGDPIPWAADNPWHKPSEYGVSSEFMMPGTNFGSSGITDDTGVAWQSFTTVFSGGPLALQHTIRIVAPYEPGSINWYIDTSISGVVVGPNAGLNPPRPCVFVAIIGDANCDGYVDVSSDILVAFSNFTGPGSFGKKRYQGDIQGDATGPTVYLKEHDGDVDVTDILTMFGAFTGPPPDEAGLVGPAEAGDPSVPDLIYDPATGEVILSADGSAIIGYSLKSAGAFLAGGHTPILGGVSTSLSTELAEAALSSSDGSIGFVLPTGLDLGALMALLTENTVSTGLGAPLVPFDLVVLGPAVPEPATALLATLALLGLVCFSRRRRGVAKAVGFD